MPTSSILGSTRVALVGAGRVGTAVAYILRDGPFEIAAVASRSGSSKRQAADLLQAPEVGSVSELPIVDLVLVGVTESALEQVASDLALVVAPGTIVVHFAGAWGISPFDAVAGAGARPAALHPVQAIPDTTRGIARLPGSAWGVTCDEDMRTWSHSFVRDHLSGVPFDVREEDRPLWHAASVSTSNGMAGLLSVGERLLRSIGIDTPQEVLGPLAGGTLANAAEGGGGSATLTGPVVRGELSTLERHLDAIEMTAPELVAGYVLSARLVLDGAIAGRRVDPEVAAESLRLLEERG